jgi:hypothetical protein
MLYEVEALDVRDDAHASCLYAPRGGAIRASALPEAGRCAQWWPGSAAATSTTKESSRA